MKKMKKMKKKHIVAIVVVLVAIFIALVGWTVWININITTSHITIKNDKIPEEFSGFKIAQISDLHNHQWGQKLIESIEKASPDIIVVTGDLVDSSHPNLDIAMEFINSALKIAPIYYVTGNHEARLDNYGDLEEMLVDAGVHIMDDRNEWIEKAGKKIKIIGIQDPNFVEKVGTGGLHEAIVTTKLEPLIDKNYYNIVLCHRPEVFSGYVRVQADLVFTGHAHGGQIRLPFIGGLVAPNQGLFPKYTEGIYSQDGTDMIVSRGLGNSIIPIRFNNMPELVLVILE